MASLIAAGLMFTNAIVLSVIFAPLAILLFKVLARRVDVAVIWMPTPSQTCAVFIGIFSPLKILATVLVTGMSGSKVDLSDRFSFSLLTSCPTNLPAANNLALSSASVSATKTWDRSSMCSAQGYSGSTLDKRSSRSQSKPRAKHYMTVDSLRGWSYCSCG